MDEREDDLSINLPSAVPPSSAGNRTDVMVDIGGLLSLCVHVCLCDGALIHASHIQYMLLLYIGTGSELIGFLSLTGRDFFYLLGV